MKKMALQIKRHGFRPKISETLPQMGVAAEFAIRYALPTHVYPDAELNFSAIVGRAVVTIVISMATRRTDIPSDNIMRAILSLLRGACCPSCASSESGSFGAARSPFSCFSRGCSDTARCSLATESVDSLDDDTGRSVGLSKVCGECGCKLLVARGVEEVIMSIIGLQSQDEQCLLCAW